MFNAFVVVLREFAELLVIAEALRAWLRHEGLQDRLNPLYAGMAGGVVLGMALSAWLLDASGPAWLRATVTVAVGGMGLFLATGMLSSVRTLRSRVQESLEVWAERSTVQAAVVGVAAVAAARETLEVSLFLRAGAPVDGWASMAAGAVLGALTATGLAALFRVVTQRINLLLMFQLSTLVLAMLAIQLLGQGIGELLRVATPESARSAVLEAAAPFLPGGGPRYLAVCAVLMLMPTLALAKSWWHESAPQAG